MSSWSRVIHDKIATAIKEGELEMPAKLIGKPLDLDAYFATPHEIRMGYSILASSGHTPLEVDMLNEKNRLKDQLKREENPDRITELTLKINELEVQMGPMT